MAFGAVLAESALVRIVLIVARPALMRGLAEFFLFFVALGAFNSPVSALQGKIRLPVVKGLAVKDNGLVFPSLVLPVAMTALNGLGLFIAAVKTAALFYIKRDLLVAIEAEALLRALAERPMAFSALALVLRMPADNLARHKEALNGLCPGVFIYPHC